MRFGTVQQDSITYTSAISGMGGTNWNLALVPCLCFDFFLLVVHKDL